MTHNLIKRSEVNHLSHKGRGDSFIWSSVCVLGLMFLLSVAGCKKSPFDRTRNGDPGAAGAFGVAGGFGIFNGELSTGGGAFLYPGGENAGLSFADRSDPITARSIRFNWTGQPTQAGGPGNFAGFDLMHTIDFGSYATTPGRNLTAANYSQAVFYFRGSLAADTYAKVEVAADGVSGPPADGCLILSTDGSNPEAGTCPAVRTLTANWQQGMISIPHAALANVKDFFKVTLIYNQPSGAGQGGVIYVDAINYKP